MTGTARTAMFDGYDVVPLVGRLRERRDLFVADACTAIVAQVAAYSDNTQPTLLDEVAANCAHVFEIFLGTLVERRAPVAADFPISAAYAARRVEAGISLEDYLRAFRIGQGVLWEHVRSASAELADGKEAALTIVGHLMATIEAGSSAAAQGYVEATKLRVADAARIERDLLEDLLAARPPVVRARLAVLAAAGLGKDRPLLVGVGHALEPIEGFPVLTEAAHLASRAVARDVGGLVVVRQDEVVAIIPAEPLGEARVVSRLTRLVTSLAGRGIPMTIGVSTVRAGIDEVPVAYREALLAGSTVGERAGLVSLSSLTTLEYLVKRPDDSARQLIRPEVRAFIDEDQAADGVFVDTLRTYVACDMNAKAAAAVLHIHVNTVYYRLDRIAERTGYDLRRLDQVIDLLLAVRLVVG